MTTTTTSLSCSKGEPCPSFIADAFYTSVDALSEIIEHSPEHLQRCIFDAVCPLPQIATLTANAQTSTTAGVAFALSHVFAAYCSTNANRAAANDAEGAALRWGLLQFLHHPREEARGALLGADEDVFLGDDTFDYNNSPVLAIIDSVGDVLEAIIAEHPASSSDSGGRDGEEGQYPQQYAWRVLDALLDVSKMYGHALTDGSTTYRAPCAARSHAEVPIHLCAEILGAEGWARYILDTVDRMSQRPHGLHSVESMKAIDVRACLDFYTFFPSLFSRYVMIHSL